MGNDTVAANGQSPQGNNVSVDGGYNADDALGTSSGAQVRTPIEAIQEFQVLTSMYDAEYGRASGASSTRSPSPAPTSSRACCSLAPPNALTAEDFLVEQGNLRSRPRPSANGAE